MLRWCQSSAHILDRHGFRNASYARFQILIYTAPQLRSKNYGFTMRHCNAVRNGRPSPDPLIRLAANANPGEPDLARFEHSETVIEVAEDHARFCNPSSHVTSLGKQYFPIRSSASLRQISTCRLGSDPQPSVDSPVDSEDPAAALRKLLSSGNLFDAAAVDEFVFFYNAMDSLAAVHSFTPKQLQDLAAICGTYSLPVGSAPCRFHRQSVLHQGTSEKARNEYWEFILRIQADQQALGHELNFEDRYWRLRAFLHRAQVQCEISQYLCNDALSQATAQYSRIRHISLDLAVHIPYFITIFRLGTPGHAVKAMAYLCDLLEPNADVPHQFHDMFWLSIVKFGHDLPLSLQQRCLDIVSIHMNAPIPKIVHVAHQHHSCKSTTKEDGPKEPLDVHQLCRFFLSALFRKHDTKYPPTFLIRWAIKQTRQSFANDVPFHVRWDNLLLLAMYSIPHAPLHSVAAVEPPFAARMTSLRTVFFLAILKNRLEGLDTRQAPFSLEMQAISRPLWRAWKALDVSETPIDVKRAVVSDFLDVANLTLDRPLVDGCLRYCLDYSLWVWKDDGSPAMRSQALGNLASYIRAAASVQGYQWHHLFTDIGHCIPTLPWRHEVVSILLQLLVSSDIKNAHDLYLFASKNGFPPSPEAVYALAVRLAQTQQWKHVLPFLSESLFTGDRHATLLTSVFRVFQEHRREVADTSLVETLGQVTLRLYSHSVPAPESKFPLRYFLNVMIKSGQGSHAVDIIKSVFHKDPNFFTPRTIKRYLLQLVQQGGHKFAVRLLFLVRDHFPSRSVNDLNRKFSLVLANAGAKKLVRRVLQSRYASSQVYRTKRELLVKAAVSRNPHLRLASLRVIPLLSNGSPPKGSDVRYAVAFLVKAGRSLAARKLYGQALKLLDHKSSTAIGNIIIHGSFRKSDQRNARLVRHVLRTKDFLVRNYDFNPDRTTLNIIMKAILRCQPEVNSTKVKHLFDDMIRRGYPASRRWHRAHAVPFGTIGSSTPLSSILPSISQHVSFVKHVRPLYRMFIKAFYLRNDVHAAKKVIGILKEEQTASIQEREKRNQARRLGIIRNRRRISDMSPFTSLAK